MKNPETREMMRNLYRLIEKYEKMPDFKTQEEMSDYFYAVAKDCGELYAISKKSEFALQMITGLYRALAEIKENREKCKNGC